MEITPGFYLCIECSKKKNIFNNPVAASADKITEFPSMPKDGNYVELMAIVEGLPYDKDQWLLVAEQMERIGYAGVSMAPMKAAWNDFRKTADDIRRAVEIVERHNAQISAPLDGSN